MATSNKIWVISKRKNTTINKQVMVGNKDTQQRKSCKSRTSRDMGILRHVKNFVLCCVSHSRIDTLITMIMSDPLWHCGVEFSTNQKPGIEGSRPMGCKNSSGQQWLQPPPAAAAGSEWATIAWRLTSWPHYNEFKQWIYGWHHNEDLSNTLSDGQF